jgi:hypothetical protein
MNTQTKMAAQNVHTVEALLRSLTRHDVWCQKITQSVANLSAFQHLSFSVS